MAGEDTNLLYRQIRLKSAKTQYKLSFNTRSILQSTLHTTSNIYYQYGAQIPDMLLGDRIIGTASLTEIAASKLHVASSTNLITPKIGDHALRDYCICS